MKISKHISWLEHQDKLYLKNIYQNTLLTLPCHTKKIWYDLHKGLTFEEIVNKHVALNQETSPQIIRDDIGAFLSNLKKKGYLV